MHSIGFLQLSGAIRAAFLIQATALWTPILSSIFGDKPSKWQWIGSCIALGSSILVTLDQKAGGVGSLLEHGDVVGVGFPDAGDLLILGATVSYSMATVRIPVYAKYISPLELACGKSAVLAVIATLLLGYEIFEIHQEGIGGIELLWPSAVEQLSAWKFLAWAAVMSGALSAYLHVKGQSMVTATDAQLIFSTVPLWSALIAACVLPDEHVGPLALGGGLMMILAGVVSSKSRKA